MEPDSSMDGGVRPSRILVVEDDVNVRRLVAAYLEREGYEVIQAADGRSGLVEAERHLPDLLILDIMLPGLSGLEIAQKVKAKRDAPILILTSRGEEEDVLAGFEAGVDDYLIKPFSPKVLVARVRAILHRAGLAPSEVDDRFTRGDIVLDVRTRRVTVAEREVELTSTEFDLLKVLMEHPGWVFTREQLLERVWGYDYAGETRTVDVHVHWARAIVEADPANPTLIQTVRGVGYVLRRAT